MPKAITLPILKTMLSELVQMPTLSDQTATCDAALVWIKYQLRNLPLQVHEYTFEGHSALVVTTRSTKRPKVMLHTHVDVSPASAEHFQLVERDGKYFGRGVFDMKYAAVTFMQILLQLGDRLPEYDLGVTFTTDEETSCTSAEHLARAGWGGEVMINPDAVPGWDIQRAAKGILRYRIHSQGHPGHGSRPWMYRNAITQLTHFLDDLAARFPEEPCGDPEHGHSTLNVGVIHGGDIVNQVAGQAYAEIDMRIMPGTTVTQMEAFVQTQAAAHDHITTERLMCIEALEIDTASAPVQLVKRLITEVSGAHPSFVLSHGGSESSFYARQGLPVIMFGPDGGHHHSDEEWISARGLEQFAEVIRRFVEDKARL